MVTLNLLMMRYPSEWLHYFLFSFIMHEDGWNGPWSLSPSLSLLSHETYPCRSPRCHAMGDFFPCQFVRSNGQLIGFNLIQLNDELRGYGGGKIRFGIMCM